LFYVAYKRASRVTANSVGLEIHEEKTKRMVITNKEGRRNNLGKKLILGDHNFEVPVPYGATVLEEP
jgi:hypothetical protein